MEYQGWTITIAHQQVRPPFLEFSAYADRKSGPNSRVGLNIEGISREDALEKAQQEIEKRNANFLRL